VKEEAVFRPLLLAACAIAPLAVLPSLLSASPAEQGKGPVPLRVILFVHYPPLVAAQELGSFADENLAVSVEVTPSSTVQMQGLTQGRWEIAITAFDNLLASATREGVQSVAFGVVNRSNLPLIVRPEITSYADLRGQPLAVDAVDTAFALVLRKLLLAHDLDFARGDYQLISVGGLPERVASLQQGNTVAAILAPPFDAAARQAGMQELGQHSEVLPEYPGEVIAATESWLGSPANREGAVRFLRAWLRGAAWTSDPANRDAALALLERTRNIPRPAGNALLDAVVRDLAPNPAGLASVRDLRVEFGFVPPPGPPIERYYDARLYEQAQRSPAR
jgi:ABC-type nitrate/sulfonate/bicarbonate transport system substrate-binding protein